METGERLETTCVCTTLRMATRSVNRLYDRAMAEVGLRVTGYTILSRLAGDGPMSVSQLARRLAMERTTVTREVAPLVRSGLVEVIVGSDRRQRLLRLTGEGERKVTEARPAQARLQQLVADEFGGAELNDLLDRLRHLLDSSEALALG